jgi:hypothetical protein
LSKLGRITAVHSGRTGSGPPARRHGGAPCRGAQSRPRYSSPVSACGCRAAPGLRAPRQLGRLIPRPLAIDRVLSYSNDHSRLPEGRNCPEPLNIEYISFDHIIQSLKGLSRSMWVQSRCRTWRCRPPQQPFAPRRSSQRSDSRARRSTAASMTACACRRPRAACETGCLLSSRSSHGNAMVCQDRLGTSTRKDWDYQNVMKRSRFLTSRRHQGSQPCVRYWSCAGWWESSAGRASEG